MREKFNIWESLRHRSGWVANPGCWRWQIRSGSGYCGKYDGKQPLQFCWQLLQIYTGQSAQDRYAVHIIDGMAVRPAQTGSDEGSASRSDEGRRRRSDAGPGLMTSLAIDTEIRGRPTRWRTGGRGVVEGPEWEMRRGVGGSEQMSGWRASTAGVSGLAG